MKRLFSPSPFQTGVCDSIEAEAMLNDTLKVLGDFWTLRIIGALEAGPMRFCEIERKLQNSNPVTLTNRLKKLDEHGYITRHAEAVDKQSVSYELTARGQRVLPIVAALKDLSTG